VTPGAVGGGAERERGSVLVLGIGLVAVAGVLLAVVVDASRLFLARQSLAAVADAAALHAAHDVDVGALYRHGIGTHLALDQARIGADVRRYVAGRAARSATPGVRVVSVRVVGATVVVVLARTVRVPLVGAALGRTDGVTVTATAAARTDLAP
jgi:uncharacterized membrane protein